MEPLLKHKFACDCLICSILSTRNWNEVMFLDGKQKEIQIGQRLGLPYLRSLQAELHIKIPVKLSTRLGSPNDAVALDDTVEEEQTITLWQDGQGVMAISGVVWDCGLLCIDFLGYITTTASEKLPCIFPFNTILDIGCGTGVCGIAALYLGANLVTFTDSRMCDALENNIDGLPGNLKDIAHFIPYSWDDPDIPEGIASPLNGNGEWDCLLCSDLLYESKAHEHLLKLLSNIRFRIALFAYKKRHDVPEELFFRELEKFAILSVIDLEKINLRNLSPKSGQGTGIFLIIATAKSINNHC